MKIITSESIKDNALDRIKNGDAYSGSQMCNLVSPALNGLSGKIADESIFKSAMMSASATSDFYSTGQDIMKHGTAFDIPRYCHTLDKMMSVREMSKAGVFGNTRMSTNTLPEDWRQLWDAMKIDITIKSNAYDTIRQEFYNVSDMPNSDRIFDAIEFFDPGIVFEEHNGEGQAVTQGETMGAQSESITHYIYAAGFSQTLLGELFDKSFDFDKVSRAVVKSYHAKQDDLSMSPILDFSYSGDQQTAADTSGANRQEKLYNTIDDGLDDLGARLDPVTGEEIGVEGAKILGNPYDIRHISRIARGLTTERIGGQDEPKILSALDIAALVSYRGNVINQRAKTTTYAGVTKGTAYILVPNRYMAIGKKRNLTVEVDVQPDVSTLSRTKRSWYFVEGQWTYGLPYFIQELTLPTW